MKKLNGLDPVLDDHVRVLILGSFPGKLSLKTRQYYAHPRNHFWPIMSCLFPEIENLSYGSRLQFLLDQGIGLWDVLQGCVRRGSLDMRIRKPVFNDFGRLLRTHPRLETVYLNGRTAAQLWQRHFSLLSVRLKVRVLPSTSPACVCRGPGPLMERKFKFWRVLLKDLDRR